MSIKGLSEQRRMPRLGKFHLGIKVEKKDDKGNVVSTYPKAVDHFVPPDELLTTLGTDCKSLDIMFPVEDSEKFAPQYYKCYSSYRGLVCKGDGEKCIRMVDTANGDFAHRDTKAVAMAEMTCEGRDCPVYQQKKCKEVMNLQFFLPNIPGLGVYQLDTGSYHSIVTVNSALDLVKSVCGRVSMIPLKLTVEPKEVTVDGKKKNVHVLNIRCNATLAEIQRVAALPGNQVTLPPPDEERPAGLVGTIEEGPLEEEPEEAAAPVAEKGPAITDKETDELWEKKKQPPPVVVKPAEKQQEAKSAEQAAPVVSNVKSKRDPATILTLGGLFTACYEDFNMSRTDVAKEAGFNDPKQLQGSNVKKLQEIWAVIVGVRG